jgi:hypothetical protein
LTRMHMWKSFHRVPPLQVRIARLLGARSTFTLNLSSEAWSPPE